MRKSVVLLLLSSFFAGCVGNGCDGGFVSFSTAYGTDSWCTGGGGGGVCYYFIVFNYSGVDYKIEVGRRDWGGSGVSKGYYTYYFQNISAGDNAAKIEPTVRFKNDFGERVVVSGMFDCGLNVGNFSFKDKQASVSNLDNDV